MQNNEPHLSLIFVILGTHRRQKAVKFCLKIQKRKTVHASCQNFDSSLKTAEITLERWRSILNIYSCKIQKMQNGNNIIFRHPLALTNHLIRKGERSVYTPQYCHVRGVCVTNNNRQNYWGFGLSLSFGILETREQVSNLKNTGRWTKSKNPVILSVIHHRQNILESNNNGFLIGWLDDWIIATLFTITTNYNSSQSIIF
jgi:hypothetical protein